MVSHRYSLIAVLLICCCVWVCNRAVAAEQGRGLAETLAAAKLGDAIAQFNLGGMYLEGRGVPRDDAQAATWFREAAEQGDAEAQCILGTMYCDGRGVGQDYTEAIKWYRKAADQGNAQAQRLIGVLYDVGVGVLKDDAQAIKWYRKAADQGDAKGQSALAAMYSVGRGVGQDYTEAIKWYRKAADQGDAEAQFGLGLMHSTGQGVPKDNTEAYKWFSLAVAQGDDDAAKLREALVVDMTPEQIAEAKRRVAAFRPKEAQEAEARTPSEGIADQGKRKPVDAVGGDREVEACNLLTMYLCILEDLQGRGFLVVRSELVNNVNTSGLSVETQRLFRRLLDVCSSAETSLDSLGYVREDAEERWGQSLGNNIGAGIGVSLAVGDITPMIEGAIELTRQGIRIEKEKNRELRVILQSYMQLLFAVQFEVNNRRGDLINENGVDAASFVTKSVYESFTAALQEKDVSARIWALQRVVADCPRFREAKYFLAALLESSGNPDAAIAITQPLAEGSSAILQRDGLLGAIQVDLSAYLTSKGRHADALRWAKESLRHQPGNPVAYNNIAVALMNLGEYGEALTNVSEAIKLDKDRGWFWWTLARVRATMGAPRDDQLVALRQAFLKGFQEFSAVRAFAPIQPALDTRFGKYLLQPELGAMIDFDLMLDDLEIRNLSYFILSGVTGSVTFTYRDADGVETKHEGGFTVASLARDEGTCIADIASLPEDAAIRMELSYTCKESPDTRTQEFYWNYDGDKRWYEKDCLQNARAWAVFEAKTRDEYDKAIQTAESAVAYSLGQNPYILDTLAWLYYARGDRGRAKQMMDEAIRVFVRDGDEAKAAEYRKRREEMDE